MWGVNVGMVAMVGMSEFLKFSKLDLIDRLMADAMADAPPANATTNDAHFPPDRQSYDSSLCTTVMAAMVQAGPQAPNENRQHILPDIKSYHNTVVATNVPPYFWTQAIAHGRSITQLRKQCLSPPRPPSPVNFNPKFHPQTQLIYDL